MSRVTLVIVAFALLVGAPALAADAPSALDVPAPSQTVQLADTGLAQAPMASMNPNVEYSSAGCSAYAVCRDGSTVSCSTTNSNVSCFAEDSTSCSSSNPVSGSATCGWDEVHCQESCPGCWVDGAPCSEDGYCRAKCGAYCNIPDGVCFDGQCVCSRFGR